MGKTLDLNDPNYEIKISKTKAATLDNKGNLKGGIGTITIKYKGADKKYTGVRTVKFRYTKTSNN